MLKTTKILLNKIKQHSPEAAAWLKVMGFAAEAGKYCINCVRTNAETCTANTKLSHFDFDWEDSPQGEQFWINLSKKLGEPQ